MITKSYNDGMLTRTQYRIMQLFVSQITRRFTLRGVGKELHMHQALAYRACKKLIEERYIVPDGDSYVLNFRRNHQELAYFELLRTKNFISTQMILELFYDDMVKKFPYGYYVCLLFGSIVVKTKPRDIDLLVIIEKTEDIEHAERVLDNIAGNFTLKFHSLVISFESVYEMLGTRDEVNVMNEVLNKHLILYGGELFYKLLNKGRK
jgi:hypothetical protein